jgi:hypothetical protein
MGGPRATRLIKCPGQAAEVEAGAAAAARQGCKVVRGRELEEREAL